MSNRALQSFEPFGMSTEQIKTRVHTSYSMHEDDEVNARCPPERRQWRRTIWQRARQHPKELFCADARAAVERDGAAPLNHQAARVRSGRWTDFRRVV